MNSNSSGQAEETQLQVQKQLSYAEIEKTARAFVASGMFGRDMDKISKGITKIMAGQELGLAPFASMRAVHVIEGNATLSANTMAGMVKSSGRYDYEVLKKEKDVCEIAFFEIRNGKRVKIGTETFDESEAKSAGLLNKQNWQKYPKAMMFARCISNGVRTFCPDVFSGMLVYTPDELNARVGSDGNVIDMDEEGNVTSTPKAAEPSEKAENATEAETSEEETITEEEIEASGKSAEVEEPEEESEPEVEVTEDLKKEVLEHIESFGLRGDAKIRLLKETIGKVSPQSIKKDEDWRSLHKRVMAILNGEEEIPADWLPDTPEEEGPVEEPSQESLIDEEEKS